MSASLFRPGRFSFLVALLSTALLAACGAGPEGPAGPSGEKGDPGEKGEKGDPGDAAARVTHRAFFSKTDDTDDGEIAGRELTFDKLAADTTLRITYYDNFRVYGGGMMACACRWEVLVNGQSCDDPGPVLQDITNGALDDAHGDTVTAYCSATTAGPVVEGPVTLSVQVSQINGCDCMTGWDKITALLEAEELK